jgi:hypothetical protein
MDRRERMIENIRAMLSLIWLFIICKGDINLVEYRINSELARVRNEKLSKALGR